MQYGKLEFDEMQPTFCRRCGKKLVNKIVPARYSVQTGKLESVRIFWDCPLYGVHDSYVWVEEYDEKKHRKNLII